MRFTNNRLTETLLWSVLCIHGGLLLYPLMGKGATVILTIAFIATAIPLVMAGINVGHLLVEKAE